MAVVSRILAACMLMAAAGLPAEAEEASTPAPADWSGFHFGFALATPRGDNAWRQASDGLELVPGDWTGSAMVLSFGRDWQRDNVIYGAQISHGDGTFSAKPTDAEFINCSDCRTTASDLLRLTGRAGIATGQTLLFATGGFAKANLLATQNSGTLLNANSSMTGWTLGFGMEQRIGDNVSLALSYDRVDLGHLPLTDYNPPTGETIVKIDILQVGMNVRW